MPMTVSAPRTARDYLGRNAPYTTRSVDGLRPLRDPTATDDADDDEP